MPRLPLSYFQASVSVPDGWTQQPCGYLLLSAGEHRAAPAARHAVARRDGAMRALNEHVEQYLRARRALGVKLERHGRLLPQLVTYF